MAYYEYNIQKYYEIVSRGGKPFEDFFKYTYFLGAMYSSYYAYHIDDKNAIEYMQEEYDKYLKKHPLTTEIEKLKNGKRK